MPQQRTIDDASNQRSQDGPIQLATIAEACAGIDRERPEIAELDRKLVDAKSQCEKAKPNRGIEDAMIELEAKVREIRKKALEELLSDNPGAQSTADPGSEINQKKAEYEQESAHAESVLRRLESAVNECTTELRRAQNRPDALPRLISALRDSVGIIEIKEKAVHETGMALQDALYGGNRELSPPVGEVASPLESVRALLAAATEKDMGALSDTERSTAYFAATKQAIKVLTQSLKDTVETLTQYRESRLVLRPNAWEKAKANIENLFTLLTVIENEIPVVNDMINEGKESNTGFFQPSDWTDHETSLDELKRKVQELKNFLKEPFRHRRLPDAQKARSSIGAALETRELSDEDKEKLAQLGEALARTVPTEDEFQAFRKSEAKGEASRIRLQDYCYLNGVLREVTQKAKSPYDLVPNLNRCIEQVRGRCVPEDSNNEKAAAVLRGASSQILSEWKMLCDKYEQQELLPDPSLIDSGEAIAGSLLSYAHPQKNDLTELLHTLERLQTGEAGNDVITAQQWGALQALLDAHSGDNTLATIKLNDADLIMNIVDRTSELQTATRTQLQAVVDEPAATEQKKLTKPPKKALQKFLSQILSLLSTGDR